MGPAGAIITRRLCAVPSVRRDRGTAQSVPDAGATRRGGRSHGASQPCPARRWRLTRSSPSEGLAAMVTPTNRPGLALSRCLPVTPNEAATRGRDAPTMKSTHEAPWWIAMENSTASGDRGPRGALSALVPDPAQRSTRSPAQVQSMHSSASATQIKHPDVPATGRKGTCVGSCTGRRHGAFREVGEVVIDAF